MLEKIINIVFITLGIVVAVIPLIWEIKVDAPTKQKPNRKIFTRTGKLFMGLVVLTIFLGTVKYIFDNDGQKALLLGNQKLSGQIKDDSLQQIIRDQNCRKESQDALIHLRDSLNNTMHSTEANINKKSDANTKKILDSSKREVPDLFILTSDNDNYKRERNSYPNKNTVPLGVTNVGNSPAVHVNMFQTLIIRSINNEFTSDKTKLAIIDQKVSSNFNHIQHLNISCTNCKSDTFFFVLKVTYQSVTGKHYFSSGVYCYIPDVDLFQGYNAWLNGPLEEYLKREKILK